MTTVAASQHALFVGLPAERDIVARFTIKGEPVSKARARFTNYRNRGGHAYTPEKTRNAEEQMSQSYRTAGGRLETDSDVTFGISAVFYNGTRQRRDVDNMLKLVLDGLNKVAWVDDNQVVEVSGRKVFTGDRDTAQTEVVVYRVGRIDRHHQNCQLCGVEFVTYASWSARKFCSRECVATSRRKVRVPRELVCEHCSTTFLAHGSARFCSRTCANATGHVETTCDICGASFVTFRSYAARGHVRCSEECRREAAARQARARRARTFPGVCLICGAGTTRKEYLRCNPCKLAGLPVPEKVAHRPDVV